MHVMARSSQAACHSFFTVRRVTSVCARRSTALVFTRTASIRSRLSGMPRLGCRSRPAYCAMAVSEGETAPGIRTESRSGSDIAGVLSRGVMGFPHRIRKTAWTLHLITTRSEEHTSELQSRFDLVCRLLLEKKKKKNKKKT